MSTSGGSRRTSRRTRAMVGAVVVVVALGGLGLWAHAASQTKIVDRGEVIALVDGWHLTGRSGSDIGWDGTVTLVGDRCIGFRGGNDVYLLVWPRGTTFSGHGVNIRIHVGKHRFGIGDRLEFGVVDAPESGFDLPRECSKVPALTMREVSTG